ncbi:MAG: copper ion binding protein, partial [Lachnospiraceae bacterium]
MKQKFDVTGMTCSACSSRVEKCVRGLEGVQEVSVNLLTNSMQVEYAEDKLSAEQISRAVEKAGYGAFPRQEGHASSTGAAGVGSGSAVGAAARSGRNAGGLDVLEEQRRNMAFRLKVSFGFLIPLMYVSMG